VSNWTETDLAEARREAKVLHDYFHPAVTEARYFRLTFPEPGKILLKVGPGDHSVQVFELTKDDLRGIVRDAIPQLL
jgi:hypothetical protein